MSNIIRDCLVSGLLALVALVLFLQLSHIGDRAGIHDHIQSGDKVCIDGGGYFPHGMPGPMPLLVCGVIDGFDPDALETVDPPASYPEGSHRLEGVDSKT